MSRTEIGTEWRMKWISDINVMDFLSVRASVCVWWNSRFSNQNENAFIKRVVTITDTLPLALSLWIRMHSRTCHSFFHLNMRLRTRRRIVVPHSTCGGDVELWLNLYIVVQKKVWLLPLRFLPFTPWVKWPKVKVVGLQYNDCERTSTNHKVSEMVKHFSFGIKRVLYWLQLQFCCCKW